jgi:hypothetical protein
MKIEYGLLVLVEAHVVVDFDVPGILAEVFQIGLNIDGDGPKFISLCGKLQIMKAGVWIVLYAVDQSNSNAAHLEGV